MDGCIVGVWHGRPEIRTVGHSECCRRCLPILAIVIMLSTALRVARPSLRRIAGRRYASNEAPQYNEPSGYLFGEKVGTIYWQICGLSRLS